ncbi:MAG: membrane protein insertase YidC [Clostridia bacterium]|nr:membrane protein insertase YidC [Clostridia bacterium]
MGFWDTLTLPFAYLMKGCYWLTQNYVLALLLYALVLQIIMCLVFGIRQQKNMIKQASLRPYEVILRKKYAGRNDQVTMKKYQDELSALYQKEGYSPLGGCLPMIIQLIVIFPLYEVVRRPLEFITGLSSEACGIIARALGVDTGVNAYQISLADKIRSFSGSWAEKIVAVPSETAGQWIVSPEQATSVVAQLESINPKFLPDATMFGTELGITPWNAFGQSYWWLIFIPLVNLGLTYLSQFISKKISYQSAQQEASQQGAMGSMNIMLYTMPLMSMFFTFTFPAAIGVYWIFRTILNTLQQFILAKTMPYPKYTDEDIKRIEKELKVNNKKKKPKADTDTDDENGDTEQ